MDFAARARLIENLGVYGGGAAVLRGEGEAETVLAWTVSEGVFRALGVTPILGRIFTRDEASPGGRPTVILSEELWARRYARDPKTIGKSIMVAESPRVVVGIMPEGFHFPERSEIWLPLQADPAKTPRTDYFLHAIARLKPGATTGQATAEMAAILEEIHREHPEANNNWRARVTPLRISEAAGYSKHVMVLLAAVALLVLIACANVSNLLLVKASGRSLEMAVRMAMGASRRRVVRQLISERLLLGLAGGALGTGLAYLGIPTLMKLIPIELPRWISFTPDSRVLLFSLSISLATALGLGRALASVKSTEQTAEFE